MTPLEIALAAAVTALMALVVVQRYVIGRLAERQSLHVVPSGHFRVELTPGEWYSGVQKGAFGFTVTDKTDGKVLFTLLAEKGVQ